MLLLQERITMLDKMTIEEKQRELLRNIEAIRAAVLQLPSQQDDLVDLNQALATIRGMCQRVNGVAFDSMTIIHAIWSHEAGDRIKAQSRSPAKPRPTLNDILDIFTIAEREIKDELDKAV
jgi:hypothetical protein